MTIVSGELSRAELRKRRLLHGLLGWYLLLWIVTALSPVDRRDWFLENILAVLLVGFLVSTHRIFAFSTLSYVFITLFLTLHTIGAHYTYALVPVGDWMKHAFDLNRNHFDRIAHFSFGLLIAYPVRELVTRVAGLRGFWSYYFPVSSILALSAFFEIVEIWIAQIVSPELGDAYLGTQGDVWDAQKDMAMALSGALLAMILVASMTGRLSTPTVRER